MLWLGIQHVHSSDVTCCTRVSRTSFLGERNFLSSSGPLRGLSGGALGQMPNLPAPEYGPDKLSLEMSLSNVNHCFCFSINVRNLTLQHAASMKMWENAEKYGKNAKKFFKFLRAVHA